MPSKFFRLDSTLQSTLESILEETWVAFPQLTQTQIAATWIVYEPPYRVNTGGALSAEEFWQYQPQGASYRGLELIDPEGLVSLFYLVAMQVWLEQGMVQPSAEIERALTDMMATGSDEATGYVLDVLSGTTSGPELPPGPNETWQYQRNIVNRYFQQLGWLELQAVNTNQKTWRDSPGRLSHRPYGRERFFLGDVFENRNLLSTEATARLLHSIVGGVSVSGVRSQNMMALMKSTNHVLADQARVWSKTGFSARAGYSAAYVEADSTHPYQLVVLSENDSKEQRQAIVAFISQRVFEAAQQAFLS